jgi:hypothetical protein
MRYQRLETAAPLAADTPVAAVWPTDAVESLIAAAAAEVEEAARPFAATPAIADIPGGVTNLIVGSYAALILVFFGLFARSPLALFAITICAFFVAMFFAVPKVFLAVEAAPGRRPTLSRFMHAGMMTLTGRSSGRDALVQMLIVPVLLTLGLAAMGIIGRIYIG